MDNELRKQFATILDSVEDYAMTWWAWVVFQYANTTSVIDMDYAISQAKNDYPALWEWQQQTVFERGKRINAVEEKLANP